MEPDDDKTRSHLALTNGTEVLHYRIIEKIGAGGMGEVYLAEDTKLSRKVALKFLPSHLSQDEASRARFTREAQAAARLDHPNIVPVHEVGEFKGRPFFAMAHIEGQSLRDVIKRGKLSVSDAVELTMQICQGLHKAHVSDIVHRDMKPANIIIDKEGRARILDFGLATVLGEDKLTKTGSTLGTVGYMSPEQVRGDRVDRRSDLFSVGVILYEMLTGRRPFEGDNDAAVIRAITNSTPEPVARFKSGTSGQLQQIVDKALSKDPSLRYQHADGMLADLKRVQAESTPGKRSRIGLWIAAAAVVVVAGILLITRLWREPSGPGEPDRIMLAVLPFENLGSEEDEYFADGVTEEITSRLAMIRKFGVISRTSIIGYRNTQKSISEIGQELGVDYILEGTIRYDRSKDTARVRITPQLIRTADDIHIWAGRIDQPLEDIFEVQTEVAEEIAAALDVTLVQDEKEAVEDIPTQNMEAYQLWLQAGYHQRQPGYLRERSEMQLRLLERAVQLDTLFARAYARIADLHATFYHFGWDRSAERIAQAEASVARARRIDPDDLHTRYARGTIYYFCYRDYDRALEDYKWILDRFPSNRATIKKVAYILRRQGKLSDALELLLEAQMLNPRSSNGAWEIADTYAFLRDYDLAIEYLMKAISLGPDNILAYETGASMYGVGFADLEGARRLLEMSPVKRPGAWILLFFFERQFDSALAYTDSLASGIIESQSTVSTRSLYKAFVLQQMSRDSAAFEQFDSARVILEQHHAEGPEDYRIVSALGQVYAGLGRRQDALEFAERAVALCPVEADFLIGCRMKRGQLLTHVMAGDMEGAMDILDYLLSIPSAVTLNGIKLDPRYDPLRDHPRFKALLEKYGDKYS
ncbi:MAG: protein kinase [Candidatus Zixiibacteriota bacterium]|nr:MAG: protein kinase [candidate division Zixibacteria bacterium]